MQLSEQVRLADGLALGACHWSAILVALMLSMACNKEKQRSVRLSVRLHKSRDEFRPGIVKISFYMSVLILGSREESRFARVEFISPMPHKLCSCMELSSREDVHMVLFATFHPGMAFHPVLRTGMKSSWNVIV